MKSFLSAGQGLFPATAGSAPETEFLELLKPNQHSDLPAEINEVPTYVCIYTAHVYMYERAGSS